MSSPGADVADLPPDLQKIVAIEVARALKASEPEAPKEETIAEAADRLLGVIAHYEGPAAPVPSPSARTHQAILDVLVLLVQAVFHSADEQVVPADSGSVGGV